MILDGLWYLRFDFLDFCVFAEFLGLTKFLRFGWVPGCVSAFRGVMLRELGV